MGEDCTLRALNVLGTFGYIKRPITIGGGNVPPMDPYKTFKRYIQLLSPQVATLPRPLEPGFTWMNRSFDKPRIFRVTPGGASIFAMSSVVVRGPSLRISAIRSATVAAWVRAAKRVKS